MSFFDLIADVDSAVLEHLGGVPVTYRPASGPAVTVTGIFDAQYVLIQGAGESRVEGRHPAVFLRLSNLPTNPDEDTPTVTIDGKDYHVVERQPDGIGGIMLVLAEAT